MVEPTNNYGGMSSRNRPATNEKYQQWLRLNKSSTG